MASAPAWPQPMVAKSWPHGVPRAASAWFPDAPMGVAEGLPRGARLSRAADFAALGRDAPALGGRHFVVRFRQTSAGVARAAQSVSKRVHKRAVQRNRIKRQVREAFRKQRSRLPAFDLLVIARGSAANASNVELAADLFALFQRIAALKPPPTPGTMPG